MVKAEQKKFKPVLQAEANKVIKRKCRTREEMMGAVNILGGQLVDEGELAELNHRLAVNANLCQSSGQILKKIELALERIEKGTFGQCDNSDCNNEISLARLEAIPWADKCLECQEAEEKTAAALRPVCPQCRVATELANLEEDDTNSRSAVV